MKVYVVTGLRWSDQACTETLLDIFADEAKAKAYAAEQKKRKRGDGYNTERWDQSAKEELFWNEGVYVDEWDVTE